MRVNPKEKSVKRKVHPNSLKNLNLIKKGEVKNPKGRHKGALDLTTILRNMLNETIEVDNPFTGKKEAIPVSEAVNISFLRKCLTGNTKAIELLFDRVEGKPVQQVDLTSRQDMAEEDKSAIDACDDETKLKEYIKTMKEAGQILTVKDKEDE